jgi:hypothetical protein
MKQLLFQVRSHDKLQVSTMEIEMLCRTRVELALNGWENFTSDQVLVKFSPTAGKGVIISRVTFFVHVIVSQCFEQLALNFVFQAAYCSLSKPRCAVKCIEALNMPGGLPEAYRRPTEALSEANCIARSTQTRKLRRECLIHRNFPAILISFTGGQGKWMVR